jgi:TrmH family RNA methyltransferase
VSYVDLNSFYLVLICLFFGTFMELNIYKTTLPQEGVVVMGNEANGISKELEALIKNKLSIPRFGKSKTESLNVAAATAIVLSEFRR